MKSKNYNFDGYYVVEHEFNQDKIYLYNLMPDHRLTDEICKDLKRKETCGWRRIFDYETLKERVRMHFLYYYWAKCEHETIWSGEDENTKEYKIDVFSQVVDNIDNITREIVREMRLPYQAPKERELEFCFFDYDYDNEKMLRVNVLEDKDTIIKEVQNFVNANGVVDKKDIEKVLEKHLKDKYNDSKVFHISGMFTRAIPERINIYWQIEKNIPLLASVVAEYMLDYELAKEIKR